MPGIILNATNMTTEKLLLPMVKATATSIPLTKTTSTIITNLSAAGNHEQNKRPTIIIYPTVSPESIVIPIVSCILGFPLLALLVICCLRRRAKLARERDRRRNYDLQDHAVSLVRFSPIHRLTDRTARAISLRSERSLSRGFPSLELDTVVEERSDPEQTQTDQMTPDSPSSDVRKPLEYSGSQHRPSTVERFHRSSSTKSSKFRMSYARRHYYEHSKLDDFKNDYFSSNSSSTSPNTRRLSEDQCNRKSSYEITGDRSPLWTTLTHAQTISEFVES